MQYHIRTMVSGLLFATVTLLSAPLALAQDGQPTPQQAIKPVIDCATLATVDLTSLGGKGSHVLSAQQETINGQAFCVVDSQLAPTIQVKTLLPINTWQGRYMQIGCGGLCGNINLSIGAAAGCMPLNNSEFVLAATDMGHPGQEMDFGKDAQKREDFAWRSQHLTAELAKLLIKTLYGQPVRWSYFNGCSDGGREALIAAQRFPHDFNGIIAGAAAMNFQVQNGLYHSWLAVSNTGPDGNAVLTTSRLPLIHKAVIAQCDELDGQKDGLISDPQSCHFNPQVLQCKTAPDTPQADCLSRAETTTLTRIYDGPREPVSGEKLIISGPLPGSELAWAGVFIPRTADEPIFSKIIALPTLKYMHFATNPPESFTLNDLAFNADTFQKLRVRHPLYDATNPDLSAFSQAGGKLIIWHGLADPHISPINSIAYHQAVGQQMGASQRDSFERLYLLPGMYHCSDGEGPSLVDFLTPMMAWVEEGVAPQSIITRQAAPQSNNDFGQPQAGDKNANQIKLETVPPQTASRPVYPYPSIAVYNGHGDPQQATSYHPVRLKNVPDGYEWMGKDFYQPYTPQ